MAVARVAKMLGLLSEEVRRHSEVTWLTERMQAPGSRSLCQLLLAACKATCLSALLIAGLALETLTVLQNGKGRGNTALVFHANRLLALHESDLPYALRIACNGLIETLGRVTFG